SFPDQVRSFSQERTLVIVGLPHLAHAHRPELLSELEELAHDLPSTLFVRGSTAFPEVLPTGRAAAVSSIPPIPGSESGPIQLPNLTMPAAKDLADAAREMSESYQRLVARLQEQCLRKVAGRHVELVRRIQKIAERHLHVD